MPDIRKYEELDELEDWLLDNWDAFERAIFNSIEELDSELAELIEVDEVIVVGEYGRGNTLQGDIPLDVLFIISVDTDEPTSDSNLFNEVARRIVAHFEDEELQNETDGYIPPSPDMVDEFPGIRASVGADDKFEEVVSDRITIRQDGQNKAFSLTEREDIINTGSGITRGSVTQVDVDVDKLVKESILDYPNLQSLEQTILDAFESAKEANIDEQPDNEDIVSVIQVENILVYGEWANENGELGQDPLKILLFVQKEADGFIQGQSRLERIITRLGELSNELVELSEDEKEWFDGIVIEAHEKEQLTNQLKRKIENNDVDKTYSITENIYYVLERNFANKLKAEKEEVDENVQRQKEIVEEAQEEAETTDFEDISLDIIPEPEQQEFMLQGLQPQIDQLAEDISRSREDILMEKFPEIPPPLIPYTQEDDGSLEIPVGKKNTRRVEPRKVYPFEIEMTEKSSNKLLEEPEFEPATDVDTFKNTMPEVGRAVRNKFESAPAMTFPRTGIYVRNRLLNEGPAFILQMYRDLVFYTGFIRSKFNKDFRPGRLQSFRQMIYRLNTLDERGGPKLIEPLSQQQAAARGLSVKPSLPDGTDAPWLEDRQYYMIVEDNKDSDAWRDITSAIYG